MNSRIRLVSDTKVQIERYPRFFVSWSRATCTSSCYRLDGNQDGDLWDTEGCAAFMEALACLRDTGSFAALSDESAVPFVGKRMRVSGLTDSEWMVLGIKPVVAYCRSCNGGGYQDWPLCQLLPLAPEPPKPRYRPYTPVEAAAHLGRRLKWPTDAMKYVAKSVTEDGMRFEYGGSYMWGSFSGLVETYTWADDNSPCGTPEQP